MQSCGHRKEATDHLINSLPNSQAGSGRHKCVICAYSQGEEDGQKIIVLSSSLMEECQHGSWAPTKTLLSLPLSQAGFGRHKCTNCAYAEGYKVGQQLSAGTSSLETESITRGQNLEDYIPEEEGRRIITQHVAYERSVHNRATAIAFHGTVCLACGFDFNVIYGESFARSYIEIHHVQSIATLGVHKVDARTDLAPLCSNCHSMAHRQRGKVLTVQEIRDLLAAARASI